MLLLSESIYFANFYSTKDWVSFELEYDIYGTN